MESAVRLFAERGYAGTSLRSIINEAGVNLAAIHYHFGSKEALLGALLEKYVAPISEKQLGMLREAEAMAGDQPPSVEAILRAAVAGPLQLVLDLGERGSVLAQFLGRIYTDPSEAVQALVRAQFREGAEHFVNVLGKALPHLPPEEIQLRLSFVVSIMTTLLADSSWRLQFIENMDPSKIEGIIERIVAFCAPGLAASATRPLDADLERQGGAS